MSWFCLRLQVEWRRKWNTYSGRPIMKSQSQSLNQGPSLIHNYDVTTTSHSLRFHNKQNYYNNYNYKHSPFTNNL